MAYSPPQVILNQQGPQAAQGTPTLGRTILLLGTAPKGPDYPVRVDAGQLATLFGDPSQPSTSGFTLPLGGYLASIQRQPQRSRSVQFIACRVGVTRAQVSVLDPASAVPFILQGIGPYAGSAGNALQAVFTAPVLQATEVVRGGVATAEQQLLVFYGLGGSPTGGVTLAFNGTAAASPITAAVLSGVAATAATAIKTSLEGIATVGASNTTVVPAASPMAGAFAFLLTFAGTKNTGVQPLVVQSASTVAAGTGTVPVMSVAINDTSSGSAVNKLTISAGQFDLSTVGKIFTAINAVQPLTSTTSIVQAITLSGVAALPKTQTLTFTGGLDGLGATSSDATIATLLTNSLAGQLGVAHFIWAGFDAAAILPAVQTNIAAAAAVGQTRKAVLGPAAGTTYGTLTGIYQAAQSDRVAMIAHDAFVGDNLINGSLNGVYDGFYGAAASAGLKACGPEEQNCDDLPIAGLRLINNAPDLTGPLTVTQMNALANAGFTVLYIQPTSGRLSIRDFLTTAANTNLYGQLNPLIFMSVRDGDDLVAEIMFNTFSALKGQPAQSPQALASSFNTIAQMALAGLNGRVTNGATSNVVYDPVLQAIAVNVLYADRPPMQTIILNIGFTPVLPNQ